jgi:hypothetical protein
MAVTPEELLYPIGIIQSEWFPHASQDAEERHAALLALLEGFIDDGEGRAVGIAATVDQEAFTRAWAIHRAAEAVWLRLSHAPSTEAHEGAGSASRTAEQIRTFKALSEKYEAIADGLLPVATIATRVPPRSMSMPNQFSW